MPGPDLRGDFLKMNLRILHDQLTKKIQQWGSEARENRQVYRRLSNFLPDRLKDIESRLRGQGLGPARAVRAALASAELIAHINEIVEVGANSAEARIQYETHMMLIDARRSLRSARKR